MTQRLEFTTQHPKRFLSRLKCYPTPPRPNVLPTDPPRKVSRSERRPRHGLLVGPTGVKVYGVAAKEWTSGPLRHPTPSDPTPTQRPTTQRPNTRSPDWGVLDAVGLPQVYRSYKCMISSSAMLSLSLYATQRPLTQRPPTQRLSTQHPPNVLAVYKAPPMDSSGPRLDSFDLRIITLYDTAAVGGLVAAVQHPTPCDPTSYGPTPIYKGGPFGGPDRRGRVQIGLRIPRRCGIVICAVIVAAAGDPTPSDPTPSDPTPSDPTSSDPTSSDPTPKK